MEPNNIGTVTVSHLTKSFKIPLEASNGIKQKLINSFKGKKGYRVFTPLNDVSFEVESGDFFGIVGRNGSGKSTLLKTIAGIYTATSGEVGISGRLVPFIELGVGFNPELTGRENIYLNCALLGFDHNEVAAMYDSIVSFSEIGDFMEEKLKNYSSGMQVRLAFSIAIKAKGDVLLLDEVLAVGDAAFQQKCYDYFEELKRNKQTVVLVTHDMSAVKRFCTKAILISDGVIEAAGSPEEIADKYTEKNIDPVQTRKGAGSYLEYEVVGRKKRYKRNEYLTIRVKARNVTEESFINMSLVSRGFVIADRNSKNNPKDGQFSNEHWLEFTQELNSFNPGTYDIHFSVHRKSDSHLLEHTPRAYTFVVDGKDDSRDGPLRLEGEWKRINGQGDS